MTGEGNAWLASLVPEELRALLRGLPRDGLPPDLREPPGLDAAIEEAAQTIVCAAVPALDPGFQAAAGLRPATLKRVVRELDRLRRAAAGLAEALDALSSPTHELLVAGKWKDCDPGRLRGEVLNLQAAVTMGYCELYDLGGTLRNPTRRTTPQAPDRIAALIRAGAGRNPDRARRLLARAAGLTWQRFTGRVPTITTDPITSEAKGAWPDFLKAVLQATALEGATDRLARDVAREIRAAGPRK